MMKAVLRHSMQAHPHTKQRVNGICFVLILGQSLLPGIFRVVAGTGEFWGSTWQGKCVTGMCFVGSFCMSYPLTNFLCVGVLDQLRQYSVSYAMGDLVRLAMRPGQIVPFFDMHIAENIRSWTECRLLLAGYANRWRSRIAAYTVVAFGLVVMLVLALAKQFLGSFKTTTTAVGSQKSVWEDVTLWFCVYDVFVFTAFLTTMIFFGARANDEIKRHKRLLIHHRIVLRRKPDTDAQISSDDRDDMEEVDDLLDTAMQTLDVMDESTPHTVVGMRAERGLAISIVSLVSSSFFLALVQAWIK